MSRITPLEPTEGGLFARFSMRQAARRLGRSPRPFGVTARHSQILAGNIAFELALERSKALDVTVRELVQVKAASVAGCEYCLDIGSWNARTHGVSEAQLRDLHRHADSPHFSAAERAALDYADAMTRTPVRVPDDVFAALREHFDDRQLVELTGAIAWENYRARFNAAFDIPPDGFSEGGACALPAPEVAAAA
ncbi:MAG TPA: carboxymuconolactone decarboxylase family protein [Solirubrobacteraceae bacterium]|jgi:AhpD family alkylhydroperoxidase